MNKRIIINVPGFGETLKQIRERMDLSRDEMAEKCFVHKNTIANWENELTIPPISIFISALKPLGYHLEMVKDENARSNS